MAMLHIGFFLENIFVQTQAEVEKLTSASHEWMHTAIYMQEADHCSSYEAKDMVSHRVSFFPNQSQSQIMNLEFINTNKAKWYFGRSFLLL